MDTRQQSGTAGGNQTTSSAQRSEYLRDKALAAAIDDGGSVAGAARRYGVSRQRAYKIKRRWDADGDSGLPPRSRAARTIANRTDAVPASRIVELRKQLEKDGPDAGAESIAARLEREGVRPPANSTIHRILVSAGPVRPEPGKRPKASYTRFEASPPDELWQSDFTHWPIATVPGAVVVSRLDDRSRNLLHARAFATVTMDDVQATFLQACAEHGIPARTLTDNGTVYTTRPISAAPGRFERTLALMGVRQSNGRPCHPQTQGKIERYHRTLKQWLSARPLASSIDELNEQLAEFRHVYNEERPHRALGRRTPGEAYRAKGKALPDPELAAGTQAKLDEQRHRETTAGSPGTTAGSPGTTRRKPIPKDERAEPARADVTIGPGIHRIDRRGCVTQNNIAGKRRIFNLGKHNAGRMAELLIDHGRAVAAGLETGEILADQTLDATREYQYRKPANDVNDAPRQM
ncbi:IS481 family transposase [Bifidobacterium breve]|uniref:IS481 family transposase n=1 Tax=Bifidobacterium breve TaxID=1685 RepID=UPI0006A56DC0|nr:IS481 family transposase [Bifidobacterium breve]KOA58978.1 integrase [Bifidobacterium breve MCC 1604]